MAFLKSAIFEVAQMYIFSHVRAFISKDVSVEVNSCVFFEMINLLNEFINKGVRPLGLTKGLIIVVLSPLSNSLQAKKPKNLRFIFTAENCGSSSQRTALVSDAKLFLNLPKCEVFLDKITKKHVIRALLFL